jgi:hypothetical protein
MSKLAIYIDHQKLLRFEELALEIANNIQTHSMFELNFNPGKTEVIINIFLIDYNPDKIDTMCFVEQGKYDEFKNLALDIARASNTSLKIDIHINQDKTKAQANILLLGINNNKKT